MMIAEAGLTVTVATGTGMTVTNAVVVLTDSVVAVIVAVPGATAVTCAAAPIESLTELATLTVNTAVLLDVQVTIRPLRVTPLSSCGVALISWVSPATIGVIGVQRSSVVTGASVTVISDVPVFVSLVAVMVVLPAPTAVTRPFPSTVAAAGLPEVHAIDRPVSTVPLVSLRTAVSCWVAVIPNTRPAADGVTVTVATGAGVTVRAALPVFASLVATMFAVPGLAAVTRPVEEFTVATAVLSELHVIVRPVSARPLESSGVAVA
jgi:hypothetical protein